MKALFVPPLIALAAGLAWIGYQHHRLETLVKEDEVMRQAIGAAQRSDRAAEEEAIPARGPKAWQAAFKDHVIHWEKLVDLLRSETGDMAQIRLKVALKKQLSGMSAAEIEAEFNRLAALDLPVAERAQIEESLTEELVEKDPAWVVQRLGDEDDKEARAIMGMSWRLGEAFRKWIAKDLPGATRWMDAQIAAGGFNRRSLDGGNPMWVDFENKVFPLLYQTDPAAAVARIAKLPDDLRASALNEVFPGIRPEDRKAYLEAMRASLPEQGYAVVLHEAALSACREGLDQVDALISAANVSPEERQSIVNTALGERLNTVLSEEPASADSPLPDTGKIDELRAWGMKQAPDQLDKMLGELLGSAPGGFEVHAELAQRYAGQGNGDELLAAFLRNSDANAEKAGFLLDRISDETLRAELRDELQSRTAPGGR